MAAFKNIARQRFGRIVALRVTPNKRPRPTWLCRCDCGNRLNVSGYNLRSGKTMSCGCLRRDNARNLRLTDLTGHRFGLLAVIRPAGRNREGRRLWLCQCACGKRITNTLHLINGRRTKSCGCLRHKPRFANVAGQRFGRLIAQRVVGHEGTGRTKRMLWRCKCDCGKPMIASVSSLRNGTTKSCGCLRAKA